MNIRLLAAVVVVGLTFAVACSGTDLGEASSTPAASEQDTPRINVEEVTSPEALDADGQPSATDPSTVSPDAAPTETPVVGPPLRPGELSLQQLLTPIIETPNWTITATGDPRQFPIALCDQVQPLQEIEPERGGGLVIERGRATVSVIARSYTDGNELVSLQQLLDTRDASPCAVHAPRPSFLDEKRNNAIDSVMAWSADPEPATDPSRTVQHGMAWVGDGVYLSVVTTAALSGFEDEAEAADVIEQITEFFARRVYDGAFVPFDLACSQEALQARDPSIVAGAKLVDGVTLHHCFGPRQPFALWWPVIQDITSPDVLSQISLFVAHDDNVRGGFVGHHRDGYGQSLFSMSLGYGRSDLPTEVWLPTAIHELAHVVGIGREFPPPRAITARRCQTDTDRDCYEAVEILAEFAARFWPSEYRESLELDGTRNPITAGERCAADAGFVSEYAATNPHEDLAETVTAYVFDWDVAVESQPRIDFVADQPEFREMKQRVAALGIEPRASRPFRTCG